MINYSSIVNLYATMTQAEYGCKNGINDRIKAIIKAQIDIKSQNMGRKGS